MGLSSRRLSQRPSLVFAERCPGQRRRTRTAIARGRFPSTTIRTRASNRCTGRRCSIRAGRQVRFRRYGVRQDRRHSGRVAARRERPGASVLILAQDRSAGRARCCAAIIARKGKYLAVDPYANAFTLDYRVWEQKFELDSLAYPMALAWTYWKTTGDTSIFTGDLSLGLDKALETMEREQDHARNSRYTHKELTTKGRPAASGRLHGDDLDGLPALRRRLPVQLS